MVSRYILPSGRAIEFAEAMTEKEWSAFSRELQTPDGIAAGEAIADLVEMTSGLPDGEEPSSPEYARLVNLVSDWRAKADVRALCSDD